MSNPADDNGKIVISQNDDEGNEIQVVMTLCDEGNIRLMPKNKSLSKNETTELINSGGLSTNTCSEDRNLCIDLLSVNDSESMKSNVAVNVLNADCGLDLTDSTLSNDRENEDVCTPEKGRDVSIPFVTEVGSDLPSTEPNTIKSRSNAEKHEITKSNNSMDVSHHFHDDTNARFPSNHQDTEISELSTTTPDIGSSRFPIQNSESDVGCSAMTHPQFVDCECLVTQKQTDSSQSSSTYTDSDCNNSSHGCNEEVAFLNETVDQTAASLNTDGGKCIQSDNSNQTLVDETTDNGIESDLLPHVYIDICEDTPEQTSSLINPPEHYTGMKAKNRHYVVFSGDEVNSATAQRKSSSCPADSQNTVSDFGDEYVGSQSSSMTVNQPIQPETVFNIPPPVTLPVLQDSTLHLGIINALRCDESTSLPMNTFTQHCFPSRTNDVGLSGIQRDWTFSRPSNMSINYSFNGASEVQHLTEAQACAFNVSANHTSGLFDNNVSAVNADSSQMTIKTEPLDLVEYENNMCTIPNNIFQHPESVSSTEFQMVSIKNDFREINRCSRLGCSKLIHEHRKLSSINHLFLDLMYFNISTSYRFLLRCGICYKPLALPSSLVVHLTTCHSIVQGICYNRYDQVISSMFLCTVCYLFHPHVTQTADEHNVTGRYLLNTHLNNHSITSRVYRPGVLFDNLHAKHSLFCSLCFAKFHDMIELKSHVETHESVLNIFCEELKKDIDTFSESNDFGFYTALLLRTEVDDSMYRVRTVETNTGTLDSLSGQSDHDVLYIAVSEYDMSTINSAGQSAQGPSLVSPLCDPRFIKYRCKPRFFCDKPTLAVQRHKSIYNQADLRITFKTNQTEAARFSLYHIIETLHEKISDKILMKCEIEKKDECTKGVQSEDYYERKVTRVYRMILVELVDKVYLKLQKKLKVKTPQKKKLSIKHLESDFCNTQIVTGDTFIPEPNSDVSKSTSEITSFHSPIAGKMSKRLTTSVKCRVCSSCSPKQLQRLHKIYRPNSNSHTKLLKRKLQQWQKVPNDNIFDEISSRKPVQVKITDVWRTQGREYNMINFANDQTVVKKKKNRPGKNLKRGRPRSLPKPTNSPTTQQRNKVGRPRKVLSSEIEGSEKPCDWRTTGKTISKQITCVKRKPGRPKKIKRVGAGRPKIYNNCNFTSPEISSNTSDINIKESEKMATGQQTNVDCLLSAEIEKNYQDRKQRSVETETPSERCDSSSSEALLSPPPSASAKSVSDREHQPRDINSVSPFKKNICRPSTVQSVKSGASEKHCNLSWRTGTHSILGKHSDGVVLSQQHKQIDVDSISSVVKKRGRPKKVQSASQTVSKKEGNVTSNPTSYGGDSRETMSDLGEEYAGSQSSLMTVNQAIQHKNAFNISPPVTLPVSQDSTSNLGVVNAVRRDEVTSLPINTNDSATGCDGTAFAAVDKKEEDQPTKMVSPETSEKQPNLISKLPAPSFRRKMSDELLITQQHQKINVTSATSIEKRKVGRPKKMKMASPHVTVPLSQGSIQYQKNTISQENQSTNVIKSIPSVEKKKVGRPKKVVSTLKLASVLGPCDNDSELSTQVERVRNAQSSVMKSSKIEQSGKQYNQCKICTRMKNVPCKNLVVLLSDVIKMKKSSGKSHMNTDSYGVSKKVLLSALKSPANKTGVCSSQNPRSRQSYEDKETNIHLSKNKLEHAITDTDNLLSAICDNKQTPKKCCFSPQIVLTRCPLSTPTLAFPEKKSSDFRNDENSCSSPQIVSSRNPLPATTLFSPEKKSSDLRKDEKLVSQKPVSIESPGLKWSGKFNLNVKIDSADRNVNMTDVILRKKPGPKKRVDESLDIADRKRRKKKGENSWFRNVSFNSIMAQNSDKTSTIHCLDTDLSHGALTNCSDRFNMKVTVSSLDNREKCRAPDKKFSSSKKKFNSMLNLKSGKMSKQFSNKKSNKLCKLSAQKKAKYHVISVKQLRKSSTLKTGRCKIIKKRPLNVCLGDKIFQRKLKFLEKKYFQSETNDLKSSELMNS